MTLKSSFLASLKENNKRRIWLWIVSVFGFMLVFPSIITMIISQHQNRMDYYMETYGEGIGLQMLQNNLMSDIKNMLCLERSDIWLAVAAFAVISGIQGFSYLYNKRKIDFYMGMPVKRKKRFFVIWLNGIIIYALPYLLGLIITLLIVAGNGAMNAEIMVGAWQTYGIYFCLYLGVYHLSILAVMLTGNIVITGFAVGVLFLYEMIVRLIIQCYMEIFFKHYSYWGFFTSPILSPFTILFNYQDNGNGNLWITVLYLLLFAAGTGLVAYICYLKRPAEAAGKAIAFTGPKPLLKVLISVPVALLAGVYAAQIVDYNPLYGKFNSGVVFFVMAIALIFTCCLMQVIYEFDIKGILHKKRHVLVSAVFVIIFFVIFRYDVFGYDSYIPDAGKVESAAIAVPTDGYYYGNEFWDEDMNYMSRQQYVNEYMYLTDIGAVNQLMKISMEAEDSYENLNLMYEDENRQWYEIYITYRMADKRQVRRKINVDLADEETIALIDRIESSEEYISGAYLGASDILQKALADTDRKVKAFYANGTYQFDLKREEAQELLALYKEEILNTGFLKHRENAPAGSLVVGLEREYSEYTTYNKAEIVIYPFYEKCIAYLTEKGYYMEDYINPEDVERIQIINYHNDLVEAVKEQESAETVLELGAAVTSASYAVEETGTVYKTTVTYDTPEDINAIVEALYPGEYLYTFWHGAKESDNNYDVKVYFKPESAATANDNEGFGHYGFAVDEVPSFVVEDTAYVQ